MTLERVRVTRYVTPLREGGSLPGIVEGENLGTYVAKFRGAGQGLRVLVAEVIVAGIAREIMVPTPDQVVLELDPRIARFEADEEVQDLLNASGGSNLGVDFLPGAFGIDPDHLPPAELAGKVLWLDALTANVDRSWRNPNLLMWRGQMYAIDHGASLYFHYGWPGAKPEVGADPARFAAQPYDAREHIFGVHADSARAQDSHLVELLDQDAITRILHDVPDGWLEPVPGAESPELVRRRYVDYLMARLSGPRTWVPGGAS